jgi:hypothetical protein
VCLFDLPCQSASRRRSRPTKGERGYSLCRPSFRLIDQLPGVFSADLIFGFASCDLHDEHSVAGLHRRHTSRLWGLGELRYSLQPKPI